MSEEINVVTPTGFLEILIDIEREEVAIGSMAFTVSRIEIWSEDQQFSTRVTIRIGVKQAIALKPAKYKVRALFGAMQSEPVDVEIEAGKKKVVRFLFGKPE